LSTIAIVGDHQDRRHAVDAVEELHGPTDVSGRGAGWLVTEKRRVIDERTRDETRCCFSARAFRPGVILWGSPTRLSTPGPLRICALDSPCTKGVADVLRGGGSGGAKSGRRSRGSGRKRGTFERLSRPRSRPDDRAALGGLELLQEEADTVDFPEPDAPTTNTNSPLSIVNDTPSRGARLVDFLHRLEDDHRRAARVRHGWKRLRDRLWFCEGSHRVYLQVVVQHRAKS
jgi:hypothetical protein